MMATHVANKDCLFRQHTSGFSQFDKCGGVVSLVLLSQSVAPLDDPPRIHYKTAFSASIWNTLLHVALSVLKLSLSDEQKYVSFTSCSTTVLERL